MIHLDCCCPERRRKRKQERKELSGELSPLLKKDCRRLCRDEVGGWSLSSSGWQATQPVACDSLRINLYYFLQSGEEEQPLLVN